MRYPIRILHVLGRTDRGGAESLVMNIYRNIDRNKIQFDFAIHTTDRCQFDDEIESLGGKIYHLPRYKIYNHVSYVQKWKNLLRNNNFLAIHGHMDSTASIYLKIAKDLSIPTISHSHSISSGYGIKAVITNLYHRNIENVSDYKFACSAEAGEWLYGRNSDFVIVKNGVDIKRFIFNEKTRKTIREQLGVQDNLVIGHIANYTKPKNHKFLIEIFKKLSKANPKVKLVLVGNKVEENLERIVKEYKLESKVIFLGTRSDIDRILQGFDIFVLPSIYEGLPVSLVEAQVSGLFCIVSDRVTKESEFTNNVKYLHIDRSDSVDCWVNCILDNREMEHQNLASTLQNSEFNIEVTKDYFQNFYLSLYE